MRKAETLTIEDLSVAWQHGPNSHCLVRAVSLTLRTGEVLALVGGSGSGKSMTCAATLGVLPQSVSCTGGRVLIDGQTLPPQALRGRIVASVLQNPRSAFNPVRSMADHAREVLRVAGVDPSQHRRAILDAFAEVGLDDPAQVATLYPFEMSGGMLQRAMIALALLSGAPFLFADEPTTDLDLVVQARILDLLDSLSQRHGLGVLIVTHDMGVVARLAHRVAVMDAGEIVETAPVDRIFMAPRHPATRNLVAAHLKLYEMEPA
ncbi:nickel import ATP-binding protein NikD [Rhodovulum sp. BSW8]|uniref:ATP-binding cassette domain-containing protein n=1 Tax=Rhodovulum sp. BSW8 TaxID=2259645 RepID=UPI000DE4FCD8|nr:ATP-binding cassette domain-containing protein [Rhodovulum sp. BSW8]RBO53889.1 nickel import ATP-binding protein NikD [Rhodovulum sp. BSW8]